MPICLQSSRYVSFRSLRSGLAAVGRPLLRYRRHAVLNALSSPIRTFTTEVSAAELQFGQPLHETHPHLLAAGELTSGISASEYAVRRSRLAAKLPPNSIAVLPSAEVKFRSGAVFYDFHQESNFFYLTGFNEPDALAVIANNGSEGDHEFHLFVRPKDHKAEIWEGSRSGLEAATDVFNADRTGDINQLSRHLRPLLEDAADVYTDIPTSAAAGKTSSSSGILSRLFAGSASDSSASSDLAKLLNSVKAKPLKPLVHEMRLVKSPAELRNMARAGALSGKVFNQATRRVWRREKDLADFLDYRFKRVGCDGSAYIPVVAGGANALTIHYVRNDALFQPGEMALVDAGGECGHYVSDITRTFPLDAKFTDAQRDLYQAVLDVQTTCVSLCRADAGFSLDQLHAVAEGGLREGLTRLGFDLRSRGALESLFPHHLSHYVGLDVHDCPGASRREALREGMCVTVEPGVYVPVDDERWPEKFRGMGIRIEDTVAVGKEKANVLTVEAKKSVGDIEELRAERIEIEKSEALR